MSRIAFMKHYIQKVHGSLDDAVTGLSQEQIHWRADEKGNHIAFVAWHYARTVDNVVRFALQRLPTVWMEGKWDERFGLDSKAQGTGMSQEDAAALRIPDIPAFCTYMKQVWREAQVYLDSTSEEDLERTMTIRPLGELTVERAIGTTVLTHGYIHLGEIGTLRGLQGLQGSPG